MKEVSKKNIKWILFDLTGVVVHLILQNPDGYSFRSRHFTQQELEGFYYTKDLNNHMLGVLSHEQFIGRYLKKKKLDLSVEELNSIIQEDVTPIKGMIELIERLSKKYKIALATNEGSLIAKYKIERAGVIPYLSKIIASYRIRELKPSIAFYKKMFKIIDAQPNECIFIDDTKENCDAASSLGITSIQFQNAKQLEEELYKLEVL